jgi:hypothetical protein
MDDKWSIGRAYGVTEYNNLPNLTLSYQARPGTYLPTYLGTYPS